MHRADDLLERLGRYYRDVGIYSVGFRCCHREDCSRTVAPGEEFVEATATYVGALYGTGTVPGLTFLSLDPGNPREGVEAQKRTPEAVRHDVTAMEVNPRNVHWRGTLLLALHLLSRYSDELATLDHEISLSLTKTKANALHRQIAPLFANINSAKCCLRGA